MPIPEDRLYNSGRLNRWFAVSSLLMTGSILWMIEADYNRPWRGFQRDYFVVKAALSHFDSLDSLREVNEQKLRDARQRLADARQYADETIASERAELEEELANAKLEFKKVDGEYSGLAQLLDVTSDRYEKVLAAYGEGHEQTVRAAQKLEQEMAKVEALRQQQEHWQDEVKRLEVALRVLNRPVQTAAKLVSDLEKIRDDARIKDEHYRGVLGKSSALPDFLADVPLVDWVINQRMLDFVAPKTTSGREQVKQLVLPDVRQRLNYLESYTTDRCTTCHIAIDDPDFSQEHLAAKLERSLPGIDEAMERLGHAPMAPLPPPTAIEGEREVPQGHVTEHWDHLSKRQRDQYFEALVDRANEYMELANRKPLKLRQPILAHPDLDLYVTVDSPHPMVRMGCTVCHEGNPQETDFVQAAHTPPTHEVEQEWAERYYVTELGVPNITFETISHYWDRPMRLAQYSESGCAKCHGQITDITEFRGKTKATRINFGRQLFVQAGCINCHNVDQLKGSRRVGPDLTYVASKLTREFVESWIYFPQKFRPSTRMPHFFRQENNNEDSLNEHDTDPVFRTETEVAAIAQYLFALSDDWEPIKKPDGIEGDAQRGRTLYTTLGCQGCHSNIVENGEGWITQDLREREGLDEKTAYHRYMGMTYEQRVRYAMEHFPSQIDALLEPEKARFTEAHYTPPVFGRFAPELSGVGSKNQPEWLYSWVTNPKHYNPNTKMPRLRLSPQEAADVAAYLSTLKNDDFQQVRFDMTPERQHEVEELMFLLLSSQRSEHRSRAIIQDAGGELTKMLQSILASSLGKDEAYDLVSPMTLEEKQLLFLGNKMIAHYGCYGCHTIRGFEGTTPVGTDLTTWAEKPVAQLDFAFYDHAFHHMRENNDDTYGYLYRPRSKELRHFSPVRDDLREEITHTHAAFAKHKLLNPRIWDREKIKRPYDKLKMPNFYFTEDEAEALVTFLLSRIPPRVNDVLQVDYDRTTAGPIARGRSLTRELNCVGCHQFENNVPMVQQYFRRQSGDHEVFDEINAPPRLWGQGAKVQSAWMHGFFSDVQPLRPWLSIRMPSFTLTSNEATDLVAYFAALAQRDSAKLRKTHAPVQEFIAQERARSADKKGSEADQPGANWYRDPLLQRSAQDLRQFGIARKLVRPGNFDSLTRSEKSIRKAHAKLLDRTTFMEKLYDIEYPFSEPPATLSDEEHFEKGSRFLRDMGCLKCHVLGSMLPGSAKNTDEFVQVYRLDAVRGEGEDAVAVLNGRPYPVGSKIDGHTLISAENIYNDSGDVDTSAVIEGPNAAGQVERVRLQAASAPNLGLTYKRLRRNWFIAWMLQPGLIQPGTKMPQNFGGGVSPFAGDEAYPGSGMDHINLLADYIYDAGIKGARVPLDKVVVDDTEEDFDEDDGEDFDEDDFD